MIQSITDNLSEVNHFDFFRITDKSIQIKSAGGILASDFNEVSSISKELFNSKLNLPLSDSNLNSSGLNFNLVFSSNTSEKLKANGYYKKEEKTLAVSLNYVFQKEVILNGEVKTQTFEAVIDLKANVTKNISSNPREKKKDIVNFVQRVVSEVLKATNNDTKVLKGFTLDKEELKNILAFADEKVAKYLQGIVDLALIVAKQKKSEGINSEVNGKDEPPVSNVLNVSEFKLSIKPVDQNNIQEEKTGDTI